MAHFVLVHGAWHGAWSWRHVTDALIRAGHRAHAVTLTGVGERSHLLSRDINLQTHVQDVINAILCEEMEDVVLAVHSYAGMVGTGVADRAREVVDEAVGRDDFLNGAEAIGFGDGNIAAGEEGSAHLVQWQHA